MQNIKKILLCFSFALSACDQNFMRPVGLDASGARVSIDGTLSSCGQATQDRFQEFLSEQSAWYSSRNHLRPTAEHQSVLILGSEKQAVVLVHGYNSSPFYHQDVIQSLAAAGVTVIAPLVTGYGSDANAANEATIDDWRHAVEGAVAVATTCHKNVALIGHSSGGSLVTHQLLHFALPGVNKVINLAPFLKSPDSFIADVVHFITARFDVIDVDTFRDVTGLDPYVVLPFFMPFQNPEPGRPEPYFPLKALKRVFTLLDAFSDPQPEKSTVSSLLMLTGADALIDNSRAKEYVSRSFSKNGFFEYPKALNIGHSFQRRENNPRFDDFMSRLITFIKQ